MRRYRPTSPIAALFSCMCAFACNDGDDDATADAAVEAAVRVDAGALREGVPPGTVFLEEDGLVSVEAEHYAERDDLGKEIDWVYVSAESAPAIEPDPDPPHAVDASGGAYMELLPDLRSSADDPLTGSFYPVAGQGPVLGYRVRFETPGTYYVWVRAYSTGTEDNGIHAGIDGDWPDSGSRLQFCLNKFRWGWSSAQRDSGGEACGVPDTVTLEVPSAGEHTIAFSMREDGFEFDKWVMTTRAGEEPDREGPDESSRRTVSAR